MKAVGHIMMAIGWLYWTFALPPMLWAMAEPGAFVHGALDQLEVAVIAGALFCMMLDRLIKISQDDTQ